IRIGGSLTKSLYQFTLQGTKVDELYAAAQKFETEMDKLPGLMDVTSDLQIRSPNVNVVIDRDRAAALQVSPEQIENALFSAYGPRWISTIYTADNQYRVLLEVQRDYQADTSQLPLLYIRSTSGKLVPVESLAHIETG